MVQILVFQNKMVAVHGTSVHDRSPLNQPDPKAQLILFRRLTRLKQRLNEQIHVQKLEQLRSK